MGDLVRDVKYLRYYHTSEDMLKDKDILKNQSFLKYQTTVSTLFLLPLGFQFWQLTLMNNPAKAALYSKVRTFKLLTFIAACALGFNEKLNLEYQWQYYDRFYPEATELQKTLTRDAQIFKEQAFEEPSIEDRRKMSIEQAKIYEQMYRLAPAKISDPDEDPNPPSRKNHW
jgi:hypothetical protein